jgi:hypothetical protein
VNSNDEYNYRAQIGAAPTAVLLDPNGTIGHLYDVKATPQMIVINPQGVMVYDGAIDNCPTDDLKDIPGTTNYVSLALEQSLAGKAVEIPATRPYGCSVKYPGSWFWWCQLMVVRLRPTAQSCKLLCSRKSTDPARPPTFTPTTCSTCRSYKCISQCRVE